MSSVPPFDFPVVIVASGLQPTPPATILAQLIAAITAQQPGFTANLPGSLIEDLTSTCTLAIAACNFYFVESVNSLTPLGANEALIGQQGQMLGFQQGSTTNTSVQVVFSGNPGVVIPAGFLVSDGTYFYAVQTGGPILSGGSSGAMTAIATQPGSWTIAEGAVTTISTSYPSSLGALTVTNPSTGSPGNSTGETYYAYRARIIQGNLAACVGSGRFIKTLLEQVPGVTANQVSVQQVSGGGIRVVCAGGDVYAMADAILSGVADPTELQESAINPGARDVTVSLYDYPDTYSVLMVTTQTQTVTIAVTWNTSLSSFTGGSSFQGLVQQPFQTYVNSLAPGQPINLLELNAIFQAAVSGSLDPALVTRLEYSVYINGSGSPTPPASGYETIVGDPESNWNLALNGTTVTQG